MTPEATSPQRIQRSRKKGWRMPPNTVYVGRPSWFGNDWKPVDAAIRGIRDKREQHAWAVREFRKDVRACSDDPNTRWHPRKVQELRGKNLACWCPLDMPCHADVLLEMANRPDVPLDVPPRFRYDTDRHALVPADSK